MKLFGIANHCPEELIRCLLRRKVEATDIAILPINKILKNELNYAHLLILSHGDLVANAEFLENYANDTNVYYFANAMKLKQYENLVALDFEPDPEYPGYGFILHNKLNVSLIQRATTVNKLKRINENYMNNVISHSRKGSLLNALMTFIYSIPSQYQTRIKNIFAKWLYEGKQNEFLIKSINHLNIEMEEKVVKRILKRLNNLLFTEVGKSYQKAFQEYRKDKNKINIDKISKVYNVSAYEMRYIISLVEDDQKIKLANSFDDARSRNIKRTV